MEALMAEHSARETLLNQDEEEIIEIDENGVVHAVGRSPSDLKRTVLRDPEGEFSA
jgi:hypothetical protein